MKMLDWILSTRIEMRKCAFLLLLFLLSMSATSVAQSRQLNGQSTFTSSALNTPAHDIILNGTVRQLSKAHPEGFELAVDGSQGSFTATLGPKVSSEMRQSLSRGTQVKVSVIQQTLNGKQYLLVRKIAVAGNQVIVRNEYGFLVHGASQRSRASVNSTALYRSAK